MKPVASSSKFASKLTSRRGTQFVRKVSLGKVSPRPGIEDIVPAGSGSNDALDQAHGQAIENPSTSNNNSFYAMSPRAITILPLPVVGSLDAISTPASAMSQTDPERLWIRDMITKALGKTAMSSSLRISHDGAANRLAGSTRPEAGSWRLASGAWRPGADGGADTDAAVGNLLPMNPTAHSAGEAGIFLDPAVVEALFVKHGGTYYTAFPTFSADTDNRAQYKQAQRGQFSSGILWLVLSVLCLIEASRLDGSFGSTEGAIVYTSGLLIISSILLIVGIVLGALYGLFLHTPELLLGLEIGLYNNPLFAVPRGILMHVFRFNQWVEDVTGVIVVLALSLRLLAVAAAGVCVAQLSGDSVRILLNSRDSYRYRYECDNSDFLVHIVPPSNMLFVYLSPMVMQIALRGMHFKAVVSCWIIATISVICSVSYSPFYSADDIWVIMMSLVILYASYEYERSMRFSFVQMKVHEAIEEIRVSSNDKNYSHTIQANRRWIDSKHKMEMLEMERKTIEQESLQLRSLIGNVAHDLKTPLQSISLNLDMLKNDMLPQVELQLHTTIEALGGAHHDQSEAVSGSVSEVRGVLDSLGATASLMGMVINRALDFTKASSGIDLVPSITTFDIHDAIEVPIYCIQSNQPDITVILEPIPLEIHPFLASDKLWFCENLLCLLANAVKYSNGAEARIFVEFVPFEEVPKNSVSIRRSSTTEISARRRFSSAVRRLSKLPMIKESVVAVPAQEKEENPPSSSSSSSSSSCSDGEEEETKEKEEKKMVGNDKKANKSDDQKGGKASKEVDVKSDKKSKTKKKKKRSKGEDDSPAGTLTTAMIRVTVEDLGIGIPVENRENIFHSLKQAERLQVGGTGLGLFCLAKRTEALGGKCGIKDRRDGQKGCAVWFAVPYWPDRNLSAVFKKVGQCDTIAEGISTGESTPKHSKASFCLAVGENDSLKHAPSVLGLGPGGAAGSSGVKEDNNRKSDLASARNLLRVSSHLRESTEHLLPMGLYSGGRSGGVGGGGGGGVGGGSGEPLYRQESHGMFQFHPELGIVQSARSRSFSLVHAQSQSGSNLLKPTSVEIGPAAAGTSSCDNDHSTTATEGEGAVIVPPAAPSLKVPLSREPSLKQNLVAAAAAAAESSGPPPEKRKLPTFKAVASSAKLTGGPSRTSSIRASAMNFMGQQLRFLIVDDAPSILKVCSRSLTVKGHTVETAENGQIALDRMIKALNDLGKTDFNVVLMDLQMPVMGGIECVQRYREYEKEFFEKKISASDSCDRLGGDSRKEKIVNIPDDCGSCSSSDDGRGIATPDSSRKISTHAALLKKLKSSKSNRLVLGKWESRQLIIGASANSDSVSRQGALDAGMDYFVPKPYTLNDLMPILWNERVLEIVVAPAPKREGTEGADGANIQRRRSSVH